LENNYNFHKPVLLKEVIENLQIKDEEIYVDGTFGAGGYSSAILKAANCDLYSFDRDDNVLKFVNNLQKEFPKRFHFIHDKFSQMQERLEDLKVDKVDGIVLDLGVSSMQLDEEERGFSFNSSARLDMRMDRSREVSAFEIVNYKSEKELSQIIWDFGEERKHRQIAKKIIAKREDGEITTAVELADIIRGVYGKYNPKKIDPATKTFQAIRIFVNDELGELRMVLKSALNILKKGGRLIVVSFHSLEDAYVKRFFRANSGYDERSISRYDMRNLSNEQKEYSLSVPKNKAIKPSLGEIEENIRSRSSRLRVAIKS
jgi:16S rRNA (cytosine1402-N4)-methyltransferase